MNSIKHIKKALEELQNDAILEVLVNSVASIENVKRFAKNIILHLLKMGQSL